MPKSSKSMTETALVQQISTSREEKRERKAR